MSAPTTVGLEGTRWSVKRPLVVASLVVALAAGILAAYLLTGSSPVADTAPATATIEQTRSGAGSCAGSQAITGGVVAGLSAGDACGTAGGSSVGGGLQR